MKKTIYLFIFIGLVIPSCSRKKEQSSLEKDTPAYNLAIQLAQVIPALHPDLNRVLVVAHDFKITSGDVIRSIYNRQGNQSAQLRELPPAQIKEFVLLSARVLGERKMLLAKASQAEISVTEEEVQKIFLNQADGAGGEEKYNQYLSAKGLDSTVIRNRIRNDLVIQRLMRLELGTDFDVSEDEVKTVYSQDKTATVRHILLMTKDQTEEEKQKTYERMEQILARARKGENFSALAKKYSEDPGSKESGGLYKDFGRGMMVRPFEYAAFTVPIGHISGIIETRYGYHILKVIDRKKETRPLDEVHGDIVAQIKKAKQGEAFQAYMAQLKKENGFKILSL